MLAYAAAIRRLGAIDIAPVISVLRGLTFGPAKGPVTMAGGQPGVVCDVDLIPTGAGLEAGLGNMDGTSPDVGPAELCATTAPP